MAKSGSKSKNALQAALQDRSPLAQRQAIQPVNILEEALHPTLLPNGESERKNRSEEASKNADTFQRTESPNDKSERIERTGEASNKPVRSKRTGKASSSSERRKRTILMEPEKPETIRDSYEAHISQLEEIDTLRTLYRKKTGRPLSKSRVIREALASFLPRALDAYKEEKEDE